MSTDPIYEYDDDLDNFNIQKNHSQEEQQQLIIEDTPDSKQAEPQSQQKIKEQKKTIKASNIKHIDAEKYFSLIKTSLQNQLQKAIHSIQTVLSSQDKLIQQNMSPQLRKQYLSLKKRAVQFLKIKQILRFIKQLQKYDDRDNLIAYICHQLTYPFRKLAFLDVSQFVQEQFFNARYLSPAKKKLSNKRQVKREAVQQQIARAARLFDEINEYEPLQSYEYGSNSLSATQTIKHNQIRKKSFRESYFELYCFQKQKWIPVHQNILEEEQQQLIRNTILDGKPIIQSLAISFLHITHEKQQKCKKQNLSHQIIIKDVNSIYGDDFNLLIKRKKRLGCNRMFQKHFQYKIDNYFYKHEQQIETKQYQKEIQFHLNNLSNDKSKLLNWGFFIVPSLVPKYCIINEGSKSFGVFDEELLYLKRDLISVKSRMGWIDVGRKVKQQQAPLKKTQNKVKNVTELFRLQQTQEFKLLFKEDGRFVLDDQYSNIYVPPAYVPPAPFLIIQEKVGFVAKKNDIPFAKLVSGFSQDSGRFLPNQIGCLIYQKDKDTLLKLHQERKLLLQAKKQNKQINDLQNKWKKIFKIIDIKQQYLKYQ